MISHLGVNSSRVESVKRFIPYLSLIKPVWKPFLGALICGAVFGVASGFGLPFMAQKVFPMLFGEQQVELWKLIGVVSLLPLAFAIRGLSGFANAYLVNYCGTHVLNQLRLKMFKKLQRLPLAAYQGHSTGDLLTRSSADTYVLQKTLINVSNDLIKYPVTLIGAVVAVIYLSLQQQQLVFILLLLGIIPICIVPIKILGNLLRKRAHLQQQQNATVTDIINENIRGVREVRLYGQEEYQNKRFVKAIDLLRHYTMKIVKYGASLGPMIEFVSAIGVGLAVYYAYQANLELSVVLPLIFALYMAYEPIKKLGGVHNQIRQGSASLERIEHLLDQPEMKEIEGGKSLGRAKGEIVFDNVSFAYPRASRNALDGLSLKIPAGMVVGVVGTSGAGKTTLLNLLPRLFDQKAGSIKIDGVDTRDISLKDLRSQMAFVPQEAFLFNDTVAANIAFGDESATAENIEASAKRAQADEFIANFGDGYETTVGEAGSRMSGGQRQRLAIARAFYRDAPILLLDEPTSALDADNETEIFASLKALAQGRTSLVVTHRLKSLHFCDKILYMELGKMVAFDTHEKLMESCQGYRRLYLANEPLLEA